MKKYEKIRLKVGRQYKDDITALRREVCELENKLSELQEEHAKAVKVYNKQRMEYLRGINNEPFGIRGQSINSMTKSMSSVMSILASGGNFR